jgi:hypothetical protein
MVDHYAILYTQKPGSVGSSLPPIRTGAIRSASPVESSVSTATPLKVAMPCAGSNRPEGMPDVKHRSCSSFCMPMIES